MSPVCGEHPRVAFGPVQQGQLGTGQTLSLLGVSTDACEVRIAQLEQFGHRVEAAYAGGSVSALLHSAPKGLPRVGQILTDAPERFHLSDEIKVSVSVQRTQVSGQILGGLGQVDLYTGTAHTTASILGLEPDDAREHMANLTLKLQFSPPMLAGQQILLGKGSDILAWGRLLS